MAQPFFKNGEYDMKCDRDECLMSFRDLAVLILFKANYLSVRIINYSLMTNGV